MSEIIFFFLALWGFIALFVAGDASEKGRTMLWGVAVFFTGLIGLAIYAIVVSGEGGSMGENTRKRRN